MTKKNVESDQSFRDWKKEIEKRCDEHLKKYPEHVPLKPQKSASPSKFMLPNLLVQVSESAIDHGTWHVWMNRQLEESFEGPLAQLMATRLAARLLDGYQNRGQLARNVPSSGVPDMCVFCGGRYLHRLDCPDIKEEKV